LSDGRVVADGDVPTVMQTDNAWIKTYFSTRARM
jgi:ABC-type transporter Mla maintaining outer membrane lipid asymmetry ATPase subunit MlaF